MTRVITVTHEGTYGKPARTGKKLSAQVKRAMAQATSNRQSSKVTLSLEPWAKGLKQRPADSK